MPRFQVLRGIHSEGVREDGTPCVYGPRDQKTKEQTQPDGDVVDSITDLCKYNIPGSPPRYLALDDGQLPPDGLDDLKVVDLQVIAEEEEVELPDSAKKAAIIKAIRDARKARVNV